MSIESFFFSNLKRSWLIAFAANTFFAVGSIMLILLSPHFILPSACGVISGATAVYSLYKWSLL